MSEQAVAKRGQRQTPSRQSKASLLPLAASIAILLAASSLLFLVDRGDVFSGFASYLLAAVGTALCVAWDSVSQRKGMKNPNFTPNRLQSRTLQIFAILGIAIAVVHIIRISEAAAEYLSELWGLV
jgi:uncharacterized membrane protein